MFPINVSPPVRPAGLTGVFLPQPSEKVMTRKKRIRLFTEETSSYSKGALTNADLKNIYPLTHNQEIFFNLYRKGNTAMLLHGVAGTGKTYIAMYNAFQEILNDNTEVKKLVIVRSAVPSRDIGFLPGNEKDKVEVYSQPYQEICSDLFPRFGAKAYSKLKEQNFVNFMVTSYVRGLTLDDCIVIVDEVQNLNDMELNSIMTRVGQNTKIIFCGDFRQTDLNRKHDVSGLKKFIQIANHMQSFRQVEFNVDDIVRSQLVKEYIIARMQCEDMQLVS
jgi:phosphate starvation-inducible protein PhoH